MGQGGAPSVPSLPLFRSIYPCLQLIASIWRYFALACHCVPLLAPAYPYLLLFSPIGSHLLYLPHACPYLHLLAPECL